MRHNVLLGSRRTCTGQHRRAEGPRDQNATCLGAVVGRMAVARQRRRTRCGGDGSWRPLVAAGLAPFSRLTRKQPHSRVNTSQVPRYLDHSQIGNRRESYAITTSKPTFAVRLLATDACVIITTPMRNIYVSPISPTGCTRLPR